MEKGNFFAKNVDEAADLLKSGIDVGLSVDEAERRLAEKGPNRLVEAKKRPYIFKILDQFKDFLVIILIIAAVISIVVGGDWLDGIIIISILVVNVVIGLVQENKADNALKKLRDMTAPQAKVLRGGNVEKIDSTGLVAGDVVILEAGDYVPADLRIVESVNLRVDESALTGESMPVEKDADAVLDEGADLGDRINSAFMGTVVNYGRGRGLVCGVGMDTEMGKIATILNQVEDTATPLQIKLDSMAKKLGLVLIAACAVIFLVGFLYGMEVLEMFMVAVSLAVAAVPEGVAIVTTMILAIGVFRMVRSNCIVKKMRAVETLGSTTVICSDKTGTLTQNKMTVTEFFDFDGNVHKMTEIAILCNDALLEAETGKTIGDPTEAAMLVFGEKRGICRAELHSAKPRLSEIPFDSARKLMTTYNKAGKVVTMNTKGAPDQIISRCAFYLQGGVVLPMTEEIRAKLLSQNEAYASRALRVLAFAYQELENESQINLVEENLIFAGLMGLIDPPRPEAKTAVADCKRAGINVKMITGDHIITACAIARDLGILGEGDEAATGAEIEAMSDVDLVEKVKTTNVFARVSPEHKVRIVTAIKEGGNIVAMTGDGVNDAPSLKRADIGIAMGITGTDVSKEAADMILTDDNFVSIVAAVEQGRTIYGNIRKVVGYLLSANISEIMIIFLPILFGLPVPLVPIQLLFVNLLTDAFPAFALGMEGKEEGIMDRPPRDPKEPIINGKMRKTVMYKCAFFTVGVLGAFLYGRAFHPAAAGTLAFFTLVSSELLVSYAARTESFIGLRRALFANKFLNRSILASFVILFATIYVPALNTVFHTVPLSPTLLAASFAFALVPIIGTESAKLIFRSKKLAA